MNPLHIAAALLLALLPAATLAAPTPPLELSAMTFNIRYGTAPDGPDAWPNRRNLALDVIRDTNPDIAGLQEALAFQIAEILDGVPGYASIGVGRDDGREAGEHCAILYRPDRFDLAESGTFWLSDTPDTPGSKAWGNAITRICTWARLIDRDSGAALYVFNTHFDHVSQPSRERSAAMILDRIASRAHPDEPVILMGDFNAGESNPAVARLLSAEDPRAALTDTFRALHPGAKDVGTYHAFKGTTDGEKIDHIFITRGSEPLAADIIRTNSDGRCPSDHFPVTARLRLTPPPSEPRSPQPADR